MAEKLMLIDGNSILNRAYYGLKGVNGMTLATSDGFPTNAILGFLNIMQKYISEDKPQYICVAFDLRAKTFRHKQYNLYKANRKGMPDELAAQLPVMKEVLDAMNIKRVEIEGFEADDIIGTLSLEAEKKGIDVVIVTGDRDSLQLASDTTKIKLITTRGGRTESEEFDSARFYDKNHVTPEQYIDVKGLMGDSSDNIPGVKGIGEKTAFDLIIKFGSIQNLYENIQNVDKKSVAEKLKSGMEDALLSRSLAVIERSIPGEWDVDAFKNADIDKDKLFNIFKRLEFRSLIEKYGLTGSEAASLNERTSKGFRIIEDKEGLNELVSLIKEKKECSIFYLADRKDSFRVGLAGVAFTWDEGNTVFVPIGGNIEEDTFVNSLKCIFEDSGIKKYGHDLKNFIVYLQGKGVGFNGLYGDTMIAAYVLNPTNNSYTVSELSHKYLDCSIKPIEELSGKGKSHVPFSQMSLDTLSPVAAMHSEAIFELDTVLYNKIKENDQEKLYKEIELPLVEVLASMEYLGFKVNPYELKAYGDELEKRIACLVEEIYEYAGEKFNINSTRQLGVILFEKLNLPIIKKTKTGYSTDAEVLEELESRHDIVKKILEYRHLVKLKSTYADGLMSVISPYTGRVHSSFNQTVTATGRISSTEPNLQNIPVRLPMGREIRKVFIPESDDFILLDADYSQIELRVLAHITGDENMISAFKNDEDIHTNTAAKVFGLSHDEVTPLMRSRAKAVNFGIVYGIGDFSLSRDLGITRKEARKYIDEYLEKFSNVKKYMHDTVALGKENGFVTTILNRRRYIPEIKSSNFNTRSFGERVAMNTPIQGSAADIIKIAMVKVYKELLQNKLKSRLILQVHDELIIEVYKPEKDIIERILRESMENAVSLDVPLKADVKAGNNWYEAK